MVVRHPAGSPRPRLRIEWSRVAVRFAGGLDLHVSALRTHTAWYRSAARHRPHAPCGSRGDDSSLRPSAYRELALFVALVCRARAMGTFRKQPSAPLGPMVLPRLDVAVGQPAWRLAVRISSARDLLHRGVYRQHARAGCVGRDSSRPPSPRHGDGLAGFSRGNAGKSLLLAAAPAYLSLSQRSLPDEPHQRIPVA